MSLAPRRQRCDIGHSSEAKGAPNPLSDLGGQSKDLRLHFDKLATVPSNFRIGEHSGAIARCAYNSTLMQLKVQIVRYVDDHFPGFVECELVDASGRIHTFVEKGPVVSDKWPGPDGSYPMSGEIRCEILEQGHCQDGRELLRVTTEQPDYVETKDGVAEFVVLSSQVISAEATIADTEQKAKDCEDRSKSDPIRADALLREAASFREWIAGLKRGRWRS